LILALEIFTIKRAGLFQSPGYNPAASFLLRRRFNMRRVLFLVLATPLAVSTFSSAQAGSLTDLRADEQRLRRQELQLDQDRDRLMFDRRAHVSRGQIRLDQAQIKRDRLEIRRLKADIRRDRRARQSYRAKY
jgi:hypothetical protein